MGVGVWGQGGRGYVRVGVWVAGSKKISKQNLNNCVSTDSFPSISVTVFGKVEV